MTNTKNKTKANGFSLAETLVAAAVISFIALAAINQYKLVNKARIASSSNSVAGSLRDKVVLALADEKTCTANFTGIQPTTPTTYTDIKDSEGNSIITKDQIYGEAVAGKAMSDNAINSVVVNSISTEVNPSNADELLLKVALIKRTGLLSTFTNKEEFTMALNMVKNVDGTLRYCFSDATLSIATAIRLSCTGNTAFYNPNLNPPYGQCEHTAQPTLPVCPSGKFIHKIGVNLSLASAPANDKTLEYECKSLEATCPANMVIKSTNANGTVTCHNPFPDCGAGQVLIMSASGNYTCLNTDSGCSGLYAIKAFNSDGTVTCAQFYPPQTCSGFVSSISPGSITCAADVTAITCPFGSYISSYDANGNPSCSKWVELPQACPAGEGATRLDSNGILFCQKLDKRTSCLGATSATNTFTGCIAAGGTVNDRYVPGSTNAYCRFTAATCPVGWTQCDKYRTTTVSPTCADSESSCTHSLGQTSGAVPPYTNPRTAPGQAWSQHDPAIVTCPFWTKTTGPWMRACTFTLTAGTATAVTTEVGCY